MTRVAVLSGAAGALAARAGLRRLLLAKLGRDVARLNAGDYGPLLSAYADDAVLHFNPGEHRWAGDHVGRAAIERFLQDFTAARLTGEIVDLWFGGPLWRMTLVVRFDDEALDADGRSVYENRTVLVVRTRFGRIVDHEDFYEDTGRILELEASLRARGIPRAA